MSRVRTDMGQRDPLAVATGPRPFDTADILHRQQTATREDRIRRRVLQVGAAALGLLYAASFVAPSVAPVLDQWQGHDAYVQTDPSK